MSDTQELAFIIAQELAEKKEQALITAINYYFFGEAWNEEVIAEHAGVLIDQDGGEVFFIEGTSLLRFSPIDHKIEIEDEKVFCLYYQSIEVLY